MNSGFVYCLSNPSYKNNIYKIGITKNKPEVRAKQLFTTGVPTPFKIELYILVEDYAKVEKEIHQTFNKYRIRNNREFFEVDMNIIISEFNKYNNLKVQTWFDYFKSFIY